MSIAKTPAGSHVIEPIDEAWGSLAWLVDDRLFPGVGYRVGRMRLLPGFSSPREAHGDRAESIVVIEGEATCVIDGQTVRLWPGDVAYIPAGTPRHVRNDSSHTAILLLGLSNDGMTA